MTDFFPPVEESSSASFDTLEATTLTVTTNNYQLTVASPHIVKVNDNAVTNIYLPLISSCPGKMFRHYREVWNQYNS